MEAKREKSARLVADEAHGGEIEVRGAFDFCDVDVAVLAFVRGGAGEEGRGLEGWQRWERRAEGRRTEWWLEAPVCDMGRWRGVVVDACGW